MQEKKINVSPQSRPQSILLSRSAVEPSPVQQPITLAPGEEEFNQWLQKYYVQEHDEVVDLLYKAVEEDYPPAWLMLYVLHKEKQAPITSYSSDECYQKMTGHRQWFETRREQSKDGDPGQYQFLLGLRHEFFTKNIKKCFHAMELLKGMEIWKHVIA